MKKKNSDDEYEENLYEEEEDEEYEEDNVGKSRSPARKETTKKQKGKKIDWEDEDEWEDEDDEDEEEDGGHRGRRSGKFLVAAVVAAAAVAAGSYCMYRSLPSGNDTEVTATPTPGEEQEESAQDSEGTEEEEQGGEGTEETGEDQTSEETEPETEPSPSPIPTSTPKPLPTELPTPIPTNTPIPEITETAEDMDGITAGDQEGQAEMVFIGDSRFRSMYDAVPDSTAEWECSATGEFSWLVGTAFEDVDSIVGEGTDVFISAGLNDLMNYEVYASSINAKAADWKERGANVYFVAIGPVSAESSVSNNDICTFNTYMYQNLTIPFIDVYNYLVSNGFETTDSVTYTTTTSLAVYSYITSTALS